MKNSIFAGRSRRTKIFTVITVAAILLLLLLNLGVTYFSVFGTAFLDMTPERLYTLSDKMKEECAFLDDLKDENGDPAEVGMIFCADPDTLIASTETRVTYYMALALRQKYRNFKVSTVNVKLDPTAVSAYRTTSLTEISPTSVILTYKNKYRVVGAGSFWMTMNDSYYSYNGEYRLASLLLSLTAYEQPIAYFVTGHGERVYDPDQPTSPMSASCGSLVDLLADQGLTPRLLDLSAVDRVPEDCALLIINDPREDFTADPERLDEFGYISDTEKIERYLIAGAGTVMVDKDYRLSLPNLEDLLSEWGVRFLDARVADEEQSLADEENSGTALIASYNTEEDSYGYSVYTGYATLASSPRCLIRDTGAVECSYDGSEGKNEPGTFNTSVLYSPFLMSGPNASLYAENPETGEYSVLTGDQQHDVRDLCAVSARMAMNSENGNYHYSYLFAGASGQLFSNESLSDGSFANYEIFSALVNNLVRSDRYADDDLGGSSYNSASRGGKVLADTKIYDASGITVTSHYKPLTDGGKTVVVLVLTLIPLAILSAGVVIAIRRRFL